MQPHQALLHRPFTWLILKDVKQSYLFAVLVAVFAIYAVLPALHYGINIFDEGMLLTTADELLRGHFPVVDFYYPYTPGAPFITALGFTLFGPSIFLGRVIAGLLSVALLVLLTLMVGRAQKWPIVAGVVMGCAAPLVAGGSTHSAGCLVLICIAGTVLLKALTTGGSTRALVVVGALLGIAALWRTDFALYGAIASALTWLLRAPVLTLRERLRDVAVMAASSMAIAFPVLGAMVWYGGIRTFQALFVWPIQSTAHLQLPWPKLWTGDYVFDRAQFFESWPFYFPFCAMFCFGILIARRKHFADATVNAAIWLFFLSVGLLAYASGRTDEGHLLPLLATSAALMAACVTNWRLLAVAMATSLLLLPMPLVRRAVIKQQLATAKHVPSQRTTGILFPKELAHSYDNLLRDIKNQVSHNATFYSGMSRHDVFVPNDIMLYFLTQHSPPTYYFFLDGYLTLKPEVQASMVDDLQRHQVDWVVLKRAPKIDEFSTEHGSTLLDEHLTEQFAQVSGDKSYALLRRQEHAMSSPESY